MSVTSHVLWISASGEPSDVGIRDTSERSQISTNFSMMKVADDVDPAAIVASLIQAAGIAVFGVTLFTSAQAAIPPRGMVMRIRVTAGTGPLKSVSGSAPTYQRPSIQILVNEETYEGAYEVSKAAYDLLLAVSNKDVTVTV